MSINKTLFFSFLNICICVHHVRLRVTSTNNESKCAASIKSYQIMNRKLYETKLKVNDVRRLKRNGSSLKISIGDVFMFISCMWNIKNDQINHHEPKGIEMGHDMHLK